MASERPYPEAEIQAALDANDPIKALSLILEAAGVVPTFDADRSTAKPCVICHTTDQPRDLVQIGTYTRRMGGNLKPGDRIMRPMCERCEKLTAVSDRDGMTTAMMQPAIKSRWIHKDCKRECVVTDVRPIAGGGFVVDYHYRRTASTAKLARTRRTPSQTMPLEAWRAIFTKEAPQ